MSSFSFVDVYKIFIRFILFHDVIEFAAFTTFDTKYRINMIFEYIFIRR